MPILCSVDRDFVMVVERHLLLYVLRRPSHQTRHGPSHTTTSWSRMNEVDQAQAALEKVGTFVPEVGV